MDSFIKVNVLAVITQLPILLADSEANLAAAKEDQIIKEIPRAIFKRNRTREAANKRVDGYSYNYMWVLEGMLYKTRNYIVSMMRMCETSEDGFILLSRQDVDRIFG